MTEVEIYWPPGLPTGPASDAVDTLRKAGIDATALQQRVTRGPELAVLVSVIGAAAGPFLTNLLEKVAADAAEVLVGVVRRLVGRREDEGPAPAYAVFRSAATGAEFVFTATLPKVAYQKAVALDTGPGPARWIWDAEKERWFTVDDGREETP